MTPISLQIILYFDYIENTQHPQSMAAQKCKHFFDKIRLLSTSSEPAKDKKQRFERF